MGSRGQKDELSQWSQGLLPLGAQANQAFAERAWDMPPLDLAVHQYGAMPKYCRPKKGVLVATVTKRWRPHEHRQS